MFVIICLAIILFPNQNYAMTKNFDWEISWQTDDNGTITTFNYAIVPGSYKYKFKDILKDKCDSSNDFWLLIGNKELLTQSNFVFNMTQLFMECSIHSLHKRLLMLTESSLFHRRERSILQEIFFLPRIDLHNYEDEFQEILDMVDPTSNTSRLVDEILKLNINQWRLIIKKCLAKDKLVLHQKIVLACMYDIAIKTDEEIEKLKLCALQNCLITKQKHKQERRSLKLQDCLSDYLYEHYQAKKQNNQKIHTILKSTDKTIKKSNYKK
ncbi:MAG: hypothetical protein ACOYT8_04225 [Candidatus Dependentiae bacterium]